MNYPNFMSLGYKAAETTYQSKSGSERPQSVTIGINGARLQAQLCVDITQTDDGTWQWEEITLPAGEWSYDAIVSAIVRWKYSTSTMEAIINNHLLVLSGDTEQTDEELAEFEAMQQWRHQAKSIAKEMMEGEGLK